MNPCEKVIVGVDATASRALIARLVESMHVPLAVADTVADCVPVKICATNLYWKPVAAGRILAGAVAYDECTVRRSRIEDLPT